MTMWLLLSLLPNAGLFGSLFGTGEGDPSKAKRYGRRQELQLLLMANEELEMRSR